MCGELLLNSTIPRFFPSLVIPIILALLIGVELYILVNNSIASFSLKSLHSLAF